VLRTVHGGSASAPSGGGGGSGLPLLERDVECRSLRDALDAAIDGRGSVVLVEGPAGIGKTALLRDLADAAATDGRPTVGRARGAELERDFALGVVLQLLGPTVEELRRDGPEAFEGAAGLALPLFLHGHPAPDDGGIFPLLHGLHWLCATIADRSPLVLVVDDLQWVDAPSRRFLAYLAERVDDLGLLLVVGHRTGEPDDGREPPAAGLLATTGATTVRPAPLSQQGVRRLAATRLRGTVVADADPGAADVGPTPTRPTPTAADPVTADATPVAADAATADVASIATLADPIWRRSGGNPLFAVELLREAAATDEQDADGRDPGEPTVGATPETVARLARRRLAALDGAVRPVARAAATLGDATTVAELAAVTGRPALDVLAALDALATVELLDAAPRMGFVHPVVREAVLDDMPHAERARLNLEAARHLHPDHPVRAATHLLAAASLGPIDESWVAPTLLRAAEAARSRGGPDEATGYLRRGLDEPTSASVERDLRTMLGIVLDQARDPEGIDQLAAAHALADDPVTAAHVAIRRADALFHLARLPECAAVCRAAIDTLDAGDPAQAELALVLEGHALNAEALVGENRDRPEALADRVAAAETPGQRAVLTHLAADRAATGERPAVDVATLARRAAGDGALLRDVGPASPLFVYAGTAMAWAGDWDAVRTHADAGITAARDRGSLVGLAYATSLRAGACVYVGDIPQAEADAALVLDELAEADPMCFAISLGWAIEAALERGDTSRVRETLERCFLHGPLPDLGTIDHLLMARARLWHADGDPDRALADLDEVGRRAVRSRYLNPASRPHRSLAAAIHAERGDHATALRLVEDELEAARRPGAPRAIGIALRARGVLRDGADGIADLRDAVRVLKGSGARLEYARALVDLGGRAADAPVTERRDLLRRGMDLAHRCGSRVLVDRALRELRATGARPRRPLVHGADALTPQERRVTHLAAEGCGNREIAEAMFLTRRTVELHLTNAYRKLGISAREDLTRELRR